MAADQISKEEMEGLIALLERRLEVIADADLRVRDPEKQLAELKDVSERISAFYSRHQSLLSPRLNHFLGNCSFDKALEWARAAI